MASQQLNAGCMSGSFTTEFDVANKWGRSRALNPFTILRTTKRITNAPDMAVQLHCHWQVNDQVSAAAPVDAASTDKSRTLPCLTLDLMFTPLTIWPQNKTWALQPSASNGHVLDGRAANGNSTNGQLGNGNGLNQHRLQDVVPGWCDSSEAKAVHVFIRNSIRKSIEGGSPNIAAIKLLLPATSGYAVRGDIIQRRFLSCQLAESVADFTTIGEKIDAFNFASESTLLQAIETAVGAIHMKRLPGIERELVQCGMNLLEADVNARLSFSWIVEQNLPKKRLALVDGKAYPLVSTAPLGIYRAAQALGVELVVLDHDGHWAQDTSANRWRDEFIACDLTADNDLPDRIVEAVSKSRGPIHAIMTFSDKLLPATAKAAEKLGLFTSPAEAMDICHDKRKTRDFTSSDSHITVAGVAGLAKNVARLVSPLRYPLIVKPAIGYSSEGVAKVSSQAELFSAVQRIEESFPGIDTIVEPYISGPEVDANFFLFDGKLLWSEINDDFPSSAELSQISDKHNGKVPSSSSSSTISTRASQPLRPPPNSFAELSTIMPSLLPAQEISLLTSSLTEILLRLGFRNGLFHLEARVKDSSMEYAMADRGVELVNAVTDSGNTVTDPSVFLIEINARVPGHQEVFAVEYTYGVDYFSLSMLAALSPRHPAVDTVRDGEEATALGAIAGALCAPLPTQCRYPTHVVFIPLDRGGTFVGSKPLPVEVAQYVVESQVFLQPGDVVGDPEEDGKWPFVAYFVVLAKVTGAEGRAQARMMGEAVRGAFEYIIVRQ